MSCCNNQKKAHHSEDVKKSLQSRLKRIEGQLRGIRKMIEEDTYCDDVLNQIASAQSALNGTALYLLEHHVRECVSNQIKSGSTDVIAEVIKTIKRLTK